MNNPRVHQIVRDKRQWQEPRAAAEAELEKAIGAKVWYTRGYLPHFDKPGTIQMVTFRLADAMPASRRHEWETLLTIEDERERRTKLEAYLDQGHGACVLRDSRVARLMEEVLLYHDGERYRLIAWVVMPNHVHVLFELWSIPLPEQVKAWKGVSAWAINRTLGRRGELWQIEYWDRYIRDETHFRKAQRYIESNPVKPHLVPQPEAWPWSSANPQWQWSGMDRYHGVHLTNKPAEWEIERLLETARKERQAPKERGQSCPPARAESFDADKIVRAPYHPPPPSERGQSCPPGVGATRPSGQDCPRSGNEQCGHDVRAPER